MMLQLDFGTIHLLCDLVSQPCHLIGVNVESEIPAKIYTVSVEIVPISAFLMGTRMQKSVGLEANHVYSFRR